MKNLSPLLILICLFACKEEAPINYTLFSGKVINSDADKVLVVGKDFKKEFAIDSNGIFSDTLFLNNEGNYSYYIGRESSALYLSNGKTLELSIDVEEFDESIVYKGSAAAENNLLAQGYLLDELEYADRKAYFSQEEEAFIEAIKEHKDEAAQMINSSTASEEFKSRQLKEVDYNYAIQLIRYKSYHPHFAQKDTFEVSENFEKHQIAFDANDENAYRNSSNYKKLIGAILGDETNRIYEENNNYTEATMQAMDKISNPYIKEEMLKNYSSRILNPDEDLQKVFDYLIANSSNEEYIEGYKESYEKLKLLAKGMPSPTFEDYENHKGGTTSLSELKGKYTYIDVWATWCGPCIAEIPSLKEIEEEYHGKNIQFVSTSIDKADDHDTWVEMVKEKELGGMQLMADKDWKSDFVTDYQIKGIPRFILVDPEGNIVSADAPRPSNPKLKDLFNELNI